jgi:hypothetical protein
VRALHFDLSVEIRRPPAAVFAVLADIQDHEPIPRDTRVKQTTHPSTATGVAFAARGGGRAGDSRRGTNGEASHGSFLSRFQADGS